eukprot:5062504-Amphidinium_carterae.1
MKLFCHHRPCQHHHMKARIQDCHRSEGHDAHDDDHDDGVVIVAVPNIDVHARNTKKTAKN